MITNKKGLIKRINKWLRGYEEMGIDVFGMDIEEVHNLLVDILHTLKEDKIKHPKPLENNKGLSKMDGLQLKQYRFIESRIDDVKEHLLNHAFRFVPHTALWDGRFLCNFIADHFNRLRFEQIPQEHAEDYNKALESSFGILNERQV